MSRLLVALCFALPLSALAADDLAALSKETREATQPLLAKVVGTVKENLNRSTPHDTVDVCREKLPGMVKEMREKTGWNIRRVSLKPIALHTTHNALNARICSTPSTKSLTR